MVIRIMISVDHNNHKRSAFRLFNFVPKKNTLVFQGVLSMSIVVDYCVFFTFTAFSPFLPS